MSHVSFSTVFFFFGPVLHSGLLSSLFVQRRPKLAMVLQVCFTSVEYRRQNNFLYPAGCALPMQPGMGLGFMAARVQVADSGSVCPPLPPVLWFIVSQVQT